MLHAENSRLQAEKALVPHPLISLEKKVESDHASLLPDLPVGLNTSTCSASSIEDKTEYNFQGCIAMCQPWILSATYPIKMRERSKYQSGTWN